jgi:hypothetical protein
MTMAYVIRAELEFRSPSEGGIVSGMPALTPSFIAVFRSLEAEQEGLEFGVLIETPERVGPGLRAVGTLTFWSDVARVYATPGTPFALHYAGCAVGTGMVQQIVSDD